MERYKHTQVGWAIIGTVLIVLAIIYIVAGIRFGNITFGLLTAVSSVVFIVCMLFARMTVILDEEYLRVNFAINIIKIKFRLSDIISCKVVKNPWYQPWGIHYGGGVWVYNVSGYDTVEITIRNGGIHRIGTNDQDNLETVISSLLEKK